MRSPEHPVERDLDVASLRRQPPTGSVKRGQGGKRSGAGVRRYVIGAAVALVLALFTGVVWFAYQDLMPGGDTVPPLIRADAGELKRQPDERGGLPVVNAESAVVQALDEPESPLRVERILPRERTAPRSTADVIPEILEAEPAPPSGDEPPVLVDAAGRGDELVVADARGLALGDEITTDTLDTLLAEIGEAPNEVAAIEPSNGPVVAEQVAAVAVLPLPEDGLAQPEAPVSATSSTATVLEAPAAAAAAQMSEPETTPMAPPPAAPAVSAAAPPSPPAAPPAAPPAPPAPAETVVAAVPRPALAPSFNGAFRVQLLASRDEAAAAGAWAGLQQRFPTALGELRSQVQRAEIGGNTFFRLHAGPFADRSGAIAVCESLQSQGADCFVVAPTS